MEAVRQRKLLSEDDGNRTTHHRTVPRQKRSSGKIQRYFFILIGFVLVTTFFCYTLNESLAIKTKASVAVHNVLNMFGLATFVHAVVIDAGSTGSRVLAFTFYESFFENNLILDSELFVQIKPGLSSFADDPKKGAETLEKLLERAKGVIPAADWSRTPLAMKATAGLRLLPEAKAEALLDEVRTLFDKSPFHTTAQSVAIMDGVDEGLFSWFTVNFLLGRLGQGPERTVAALDLGGGSTQVTFAPGAGSKLAASDAAFLHNVAAFHQNVSVYTHSLLGLGLMAARKEILAAGLPSDATVLTSLCVNPIVSVDWPYGGKTYTVRGDAKKAHSKNPQADYAKCQAAANAYVGPRVTAPPGLASAEINAFSYYFDRAAETGLIDPFLGGTLQVSDFDTAAKAACAAANADQPFMCVDLVFISALLEHGFGLSPSTRLNLYKQVDGHEISWALGAAFHMMQNGI